MPDATSDLSTTRRPALVAFVLARWRGEVPLRVALWRDMWGVGTVVNLAAALVALLLLAKGAPDVLGAAVYFAPLPYNLLLLVSVWRSADKAPDASALAAQLLAVLWVLLAVLL